MVDGMKNYTKMFGQTCRTILIEKFADKDINDEPVVSMDKLLDENIGKDINHKQLIEKLSISSYKEFVDRFMPCVYCVTTGDAKGHMVSYSLEKPNGVDNPPTVLRSQDFYELINKLYERRQNSGQAVVDFDFEDVTKILNPREKAAEIKRIRGEIEYNFNEYNKLEAANPNLETAEKAKYYKKFWEGMDYFNQVVGQDMDSSLPVLLSRTYNDLLELTGSKSAEGDSGEAAPKLLERYFDDAGNIKVKELPMKESNGEDGDEEEVKLLDIFKEEYENNVSEALKGSESIKALVLASFCSKALVPDRNSDELKQLAKTYEEEYKQCTESLCSTLAPVIEKFLGVRAFFDNALSKGQTKLDTPLLVTNCTAKELASKKEHFKEFLELYNGAGRPLTGRFWYGIIPAVALGEEKQQSSETPSSVGGSIRRRYSDVGKKSKEMSLVTAPEAKEIMDICAENHIVVFYNFKATSSTNFDMGLGTLESMMEGIKFSDDEESDLNGSYAVCCYPNFTVLPKSESVVINRDLVDKEILDNLTQVKLPEVYLEASYVACGMVVGSQDFKVLKEKGLIIDRDLTAVRIDFEDGIVQNKYVSNMPLERDQGMDSKVVGKAEGNKFGFFFYDNGHSEHCEVKFARTMRKKANNQYRKLNNVVFGDFVELVLRNEGTKITESNVESFKKNEYEKWTFLQQEQEGKSVNDRLVNALLKIDPSRNDVKESIGVDITDQKILYRIKFLKDEEEHNVQRQIDD